MKTEKECTIEILEVNIAYCKAKIGELSALGERTKRREFYFEAQHWIDIMKQKYMDLEHIREPKIIGRVRNG